MWSPQKPDSVLGSGVNRFKTVPVSLSTTGFVHIHLANLAKLSAFCQIFRHMPWQIVGKAVMSLLSLAELSGKACFIF